MSHVIAVMSMSVSVTVYGASTCSGSTCSSAVTVFCLQEFSGRIDFWKRCQNKERERKPEIITNPLKTATVTVVYVNEW